jgi:hypothetical protein
MLVRQEPRGLRAGASHLSALSMNHATVLQCNSTCSLLNIPGPTLFHLLQTSHLSPPTPVFITLSSTLLLLLVAPFVLCET